MTSISTPNSHLLHLPHPNPHSFRAMMGSPEHYFSQLAGKLISPEILSSLRGLQDTYIASPSHLVLLETQRPPPAPPVGYVHDLQSRRLAS